MKKVRETIVLWTTCILTALAPFLLLKNIQEKKNPQNLTSKSEVIYGAF